MLQNAYFLAKIGADTAENERNFAEILPKICRKLATTPPSCGDADEGAGPEGGGRAGPQVHERSGILGVRGWQNWEY